ncbi:hypothetical protein V6N12_055923 [Hibiscus sabdariffa]|uniref:Uncharacterized protein n=1 Tax=Hibiscus sabdariffa TaxID=183260 RepID=A0ABR2CQZ4_9ROSI
MSWLNRTAHYLRPSLSKSQREIELSIPFMPQSKPRFPLQSCQGALAAIAFICGLVVGIMEVDGADEKGLFAY